MNIWYISKYARPLKYGFGTRHFYLAKEINKKGHNTTVISSDSTHTGTYPDFPKRYTYEKHHGVDTWFIKTKKYKNPHGIGRILSWIDFELKLFFWKKKKLFKPDVIIVSSLSLFTILTGYLFKKKYNTKLIFEVRDIWPLTIIEVGGFNPNNPFVKLLSWIEKFGYEKADLIVGTLPNLKEHVEKVLGYRKETYCIPQGFDEHLFANPEELSKDYVEKYIPKNKFIVGYAGTVGASNALETLVSCARELKDDKDIHILIVGNGNKRDEFIEQTADLNNITFAPKIKREQVQSVLSYCDVLYDSVKEISLYRYGLSRNKWVDYMYAGKPMLISYNGYKTMVNEAENGYFVKPESISDLKEKVLEFKNLSDLELQKIGKRGKEWVIKNRTFDKLADKYLELIINA